jgi:hypothetical protein
MSDSEQVRVPEEQSVLEQLKAIDEQYILKKYEERVNYYWKASRNNKNSYKRYRSWTIFLGSLVTLVSSISAAEFVQRPEGLRIAFAVATPVIAATLTVISGWGKTFIGAPPGVIWFLMQCAWRRSGTASWRPKKKTGTWRKNSTS